MTLAAFLILVAIGFFVGGFGALAGVGGGVILAPLVALYYGLPMHQAIGVSLVCVIATSTAPKRCSWSNTSPTSAVGWFAVQMFYKVAIAGFR